MMKKLLLLLLVLAFFVGGGSLRIFAAVDVPSQDFPLSSPVGAITGQWNKDTQELMIVGSGKIDGYKWASLKITTLKLTTNDALGAKIIFGNSVKFPDISNGFFENIKSGIEFPTSLDTSNLINTVRMFQGATNFNVTALNWSLPNLVNMQNMFAGTSAFTGEVHFTDLRKLTTALYAFNNSKVREVSLNDTLQLQDLRYTFANSAVEKVIIPEMSKVTSIDSMLAGASNFHEDHLLRDLPELVSMGGAFQGTVSFTGIAHLTSTTKLTNLAGAFAQSSVKEVSIDHTENVTSMTNTFYLSTKVEKVLFNDTSKVKSLIQTFWGAGNFNWDISHWSFSGLTATTHHFINQGTRAFSRENYEKLLNAWATRLPLTPVTGITVSITSNYCLAKPARDQIIAKGYTIISDRLDCELMLTVNQPTKSSSGDIIDTTVRVSSLLDLDLTKIKIVNATLGYTDFSCSFPDPTNKKVAECGLKITSTPNGSNSRIVFQATDAVNMTKTFTASGYLIDRVKPSLGQVTIDTTPDIHTPTVRMQNLPTDAGGAGIRHCDLVYRDASGVEQTRSPFPVGSDETLTFDPIETVHTIKVLCYDQVGNSSENLIKFPPIVTFNSNNVTIKNGPMHGAFEVYSPSSVAITTLQVAYDDATPVNYSCRSQINGATLPPFLNSPTQPILCSYTNASLSGNLVVKAQDANGAEGQQMQTLILDTTAPTITFNPTSALTSGNLALTVNIFDAVGINSGAVSIDPLATTLDYPDWNCIQVDRYNVRCQFTADIEIQNGSLTITATDLAGNGSNETTAGYAIDKTAPRATNLNQNLQASGTELSVSFEVSDTGGAGLWTASESSDPLFDRDALSYGVATAASCSDFVQLGSSFTAQASEPFSFTFELTDATHNGKQLCLQFKDKVGNLSRSGISLINLNLAPTLAGQETTVNENLPVGTLIFILTGVDANTGDTLSYEIMAGNTGNAFSIAGNTLITSGGLDYETLSGYVLTLQVTDQFGLSGSGEFKVHLNDLDEIPPTLTSVSHQSYLIGSTISPILFTGSDNEMIANWTVTGLPAGLSYTGATGSTTSILTLSGTLTAPAGSYPITVTLTDTAGNQTIQTFTITITVPASSSSGYSGGGGRVLSQDHPQKSETQTPDKMHYTDTQLFNPTIEDGKCYTRRVFQGIHSSKTIFTTEEFNKALSFLWTYEMTKYDSVAGYDPYRNLSRQEAAKIFSQFATNVLCRKPDQNLKVNYSDTENADPSLKPYITLAYQLGLMKGSGQGDGFFRPYEMISKAEVNAVLIRMILKAYLNENQSIWYQNYNEVATKLGIINQGAGLQSVPRNDVALMLFRAYKNQVFDRQEIDYFSYVLKTRAQFLSQE